MTTASWWQKSTLAVVAALGFCGSAMADTTTTISGSQFNDGNLVGSYNGTYNGAIDGGVMQLSYSVADVPNDAVVGVKGPLGLLSNLSMSFASSNPVGTGYTPFAAFGVSVDGLWSGSAYKYNVISMNGSQLTGTSLVHVWDWTLNGGNGGDVAGLSNVTLNSILGVANSFNNVAYGALQVMRAYAYIGDTGGASSGSLDINSITVTAVPEPETFAMLLAGLGLIGTISRRRSIAAANA